MHFFLFWLVALFLLFGDHHVHLDELKCADNQREDVEIDFCEVEAEEVRVDFGKVEVVVLGVKEVGVVGIDTVFDDMEDGEKEGELE